MGFMRKQMLLQQRASFELTLQERMSYLWKKGIRTSKTGQDPVVSKLNADIRAVNSRLKAVDDSDRKAAETAKTGTRKTRTPAALA